MHFWTRDKLRSCIKSIKIPAPGADHRVHKGLNNAIEVSHRPTRKREKIFGRFKSHRQAPRFLSAPDHPLVAASSYCWAVDQAPTATPVAMRSASGAITPPKWRHNTQSSPMLHNRPPTTRQYQLDRKTGCTNHKYCPSCEQRGITRKQLNAFGVQDNENDDDHS